LKSVHISTGAKPNSQPTERSNSPAVISSVMASAMRPSSTVKVSVFEILSMDRKYSWRQLEGDAFYWMRRGEKPVRWTLNSG